MLRCVSLSLQDSQLDMRTSAAVESLLSLRGEWRPPSPASSTVSENQLSPLRVAREEVVVASSDQETASKESESRELPYKEDVPSSYRQYNPVPTIVSHCTELLCLRVVVLTAMSAKIDLCGLTFSMARAANHPRTFLRN